MRNSHTVSPAFKVIWAMAFVVAFAQPGFCEVPNSLFTCEAKGTWKLGSEGLEKEENTPFKFVIDTASGRISFAEGSKKLNVKVKELKRPPNLDAEWVFAAPTEAEAESAIGSEREFVKNVADMLLVHVLPDQLAFWASNPRRIFTGDCAISTR